MDYLANNLFFKKKIFSNFFHVIWLHYRSYIWIWILFSKKFFLVNYRGKRLNLCKIISVIVYGVVFWPILNGFANDLLHWIECRKKIGFCFILKKKYFFGFLRNNLFFKKNLDFLNFFHFVWSHYRSDTRIWNFFEKKFFFANYRGKRLNFCKIISVSVYGAVSSPILSGF